MKITHVKVFQVDLPLKEGRYSWSNDNFVEVFDSTIVEITTDQGLVGYGECCPLGSTYLPAFAPGVRAGLQKIAPQLIGQNPLNIGEINRLMDTCLLGHPYVKAPIDIACWDLLGKATGQPVYNLLGGRAQDEIALYRAISQETPLEMAKNVEKYAKEGYTKFQLKVGGNAKEDIKRIHNAREVLAENHILVADANTGWSKHDAVRVANAISNLDVYLEQPCKTYQECISVRSRTNLPFILDEVIDSPNVLLHGIVQDAMDVINLKISKVGGLTNAKLMRDICVSQGIPMTLEDTWGGDITTAAIAHLAQSTTEDYCFSATDFNSYVTVSIADGAPKRVNGYMTASERPGLGISPDFRVLGNPVATYYL